MTTVMKREVERKIVDAFLTSALAAGYTINVNNGGDDDELPAPTADKAAILNAMFATDDEHLIVYRGGKRFGWVYLIYCNSGWDVISDHSTNLRHVMGDAEKVGDYYAG